MANSRDLETWRMVAVSMETQACYLCPVSQVSPTDPGEECALEQLPALTLATGWSLGNFPYVKKHQVARLKTGHFKLENTVI